MYAAPSASSHGSMAGSASYSSAVKPPASRLTARKPRNTPNIYLRLYKNPRCAAPDIQIMLFGPGVMQLSTT